MDQYVKKLACSKGLQNHVIGNKALPSDDRSNCDGFAITVGGENVIEFETEHSNSFLNDSIQDLNCDIYLNLS